MSVQDVIDGTRRWGVAVGDCTESLRALPDGCAQCCVTSPPYYGLRSYLPAGHPDKAKEIGLEETPEAYIARMVGVFAEVKRVLRADGVLWVNIGDSYNAYNGNRGRSTSFSAATEDAMPSLPGGCGLTVKGLKNKDRIGIPHMLAFALRADGWYFRDEVIWHKPNPMPSSTTDRTTAAHEFVFMFSKSARYYYDGLAIAEKSTTFGRQGTNGPSPKVQAHRSTGGGYPATDAYSYETRNKRSVWRISTRPYKGSHYATYPPALVAPCILAGTSAKGCCPACGSPWTRVVERKRVATRPGTDTKIAEPGENKQDQAGNRQYTGFNARYKAAKEVGNRDPQRHVTSTETTGWRPSCGCGNGLLPDDLDVIHTPQGERVAEDPSAVVGRAGFSRPRGEAEGVRPMTRYEQRQYAAQLKASAHKALMAEQAGSAFAHYLRTDRSGARPIPAELLADWIDRGWLTPVTVPTGEPLQPVPCIVLDPFVGSGTTLQVANEHGRRAIGCDLDERNLKLIRGRMELVQPLIPGAAA